MFPIIWMCMIALKGAGESVSGFNSLILKNPSLGNLKRLFELLPNFWKNFYNSVFTTFSARSHPCFFAPWLVLRLQNTSSRAIRHCFISAWQPC